MLISKNSCQSAEGVQEKNMGGETNIAKAYNRFSLAIIVLTIIWILIYALSVYINIQRNFKEIIKVQQINIERIFSDSISLIDNTANYIGNKAIFLGADNKSSVSKLLTKNNNFKTIPKNTQSFLEFDYVRNDNIVISSKEGILENPIKVPNYYLTKESLKNKWMLTIGEMMDKQNIDGKDKVIPISLTIVDDKELRLALISEISVKKIAKNIKDKITNKKISYIVLSKNFNIIAKSEDNKLPQNKGDLASISESLSQNYELKDIFKQLKYNQNFIKNKEFKTTITIGDLKYKDYRQSKYPFVILVTYSKEELLKAFIRDSKILIIASTIITLLFLLTLFLFKKIQITPIIKNLLNAKMKAEELSKTKSNFISKISHELRTPMNGIIGMSQILLESKCLSNDDIDKVNTINRSANSLLYILNDILNFSKIDAKKVYLERDDFNLHSLIWNVVEIMSLTASKKNLEIFVSFDSKVPRILIGDSMRLEQIIINLMNNAIKFTEAGQIIIKVLLIEESKKNVKIQFNIKDSGIGIKKNEIKSIFDEFTQADMSNTRKYDGAGLGLSICKELIKLMGGNIKVQSLLDEGSDFSFTISLDKSKKTNKKLQFISNSKLENIQISLIENNVIGRYIFKENFANFINQEIKTIDLSSNFDMAKVINKIDLNSELIFISNFKNKDLNAIWIAKKIKSTAGLKNISLVLVASIYEKDKILEEDKKLFYKIITKPIKELSFKRLVLDFCQIKYKKESFDLLGTDHNKTFTRKYKILLCEDNKININVVLAMLTNMGHEIDVAKNGQIGFDRIFKDKINYDLILMDCMMPVMDGFTLTQKIRKEERDRDLKKIPIIAITANTEEEDKNRCFKCGMDYFLEKPLKQKQIKDILSIIDNTQD